MWEMEDIIKEKFCDSYTLFWCCRSYFEEGWDWTGEIRNIMYHVQALLCNR
jgi:hypothetical protein